MNWKIPLFKIYNDEEDVSAVSKVIKRGAYWAEGPEIKEFEEKLAEYVGAKHAIVFNSGTSALHATLIACGVKGKEVIVPSFTFISTANSVALAGAKPVFAEVEGDTYCLDVADVEKRITGNTIGVIPMHYGGATARDIEKIKELCDKKGLLMIEDAAESLGAKHNGKMSGTFGAAGMYSFCQNKIIATGEGGAITTEDEKIARKLEVIRSHGREIGDYFSSSREEDYLEIGYNYRISTMQAALGLSQLNKVDKIIEMRRKNAKYFNKKLAGITGLKTPKELEGNFNVYQLYTIELENAEKRDGLKEHLAKSGVMSKVYFSAAHLKTFYRKSFGCGEGQLPFTEKLQKRVLTLPFWPQMGKREIDSVAEDIKGFFEEGK